MPLRRQLLTWVVLALVVVVGAALGRTPEPVPPVASAPAVAAAVEAVDAVEVGVGAVAEVAPQGAPGDDTAPCVLRSDCAGAWTFGAVGLLLAVAVAVPAVGFVPTVRRVVAAPTVLHSALLPSGLFRPPQTS